MPRLFGLLGARRGARSGRLRGLGANAGSLSGSTPGPDPDPYIAHAVQVGLGDKLVNMSLVATGDGTGHVSYVYWRKMSEADFANQGVIWVQDPENFYPSNSYYSDGGGVDPYGFEHMQFCSAEDENCIGGVVGGGPFDAGTPVPLDVWFPIFVCVDTNKTDVNDMILMVYIGDDLVVFDPGRAPPSNYSDLAPFFMTWNGLTMHIFDDANPATVTGQFADFWFAPGQFIDFSVEANRRKFMDAAGYPVYLGADGSLPTGTAPAIFFSASNKDATPFETNRGTGGAFTLTGTLPDADTSPSDYQARAVALDTSTQLVCAATAASDTGLLSFSLWFRTPAPLPVGEQYWFGVQQADDSITPAMSIPSNGPGAQEVSVYSYSADLTYGYQAGNQFSTVEGKWHHILFSGDMSAPQAQQYLDDVPQRDLDPDFVLHDGFTAGGALTLSGRKLIFGGFADPLAIPRDVAIEVADLWISFGTSLLDGDGNIPEATRRQFIDADGRPVDPAGFPTASVLFTGRADTFATNLGDAGAFTVTGALTDATGSEPISAGAGGRPPVNTVLPVITGTAQEGQTLTATTGTWTGLGPITYHYQWKAAGSFPVGTDQNTIELGIGEVGTAITVEVTATNEIGDTSATSLPTATVIPA